MKWLIVFAAFVCAASLAQAQSDVYVCRNPDGSRDYKNSGDTTGCLRVDAEPSKEEIQEREALAREMRKMRMTTVLIGMNEHEVAKVWGKPTARYTRVSRNGTTTVLKYPGHGVVTFNNGRVEVIEQ